MDKKNKSDNMSLTDFEHDGVIYEPSEHNDNYNEEILSNNLKKKKKVAIEDFNFRFFIASISIVAVCILITTFMTLKPYILDFISPTASQSMVDTSYNELVPQKNEGSTLDDFSEVFVSTSKEATGMITEINYTDQILKITDLSTNIEYLLKSKIATVFEDKYGNSLTFQELNIGDIVDFSYDLDDKLNYVFGNSETFTMEGVIPTKVEIKNSTIQLNNTIYNVYKNAIITKNDESISFNDISTETKLTVSGYKNIVISIEVEVSTGFLLVQNRPSLTNAYLAIDRDFYKPLESIERVELQEGTHTVIVTSNETDQFVREVNIVAGEEYVLNMQDVENKSGSLTIKANVSDYRLYIDDLLTSTDSTISLKYGTYTVRVEKEAYEAYETQVNISSSQNIVDATLTKFDQLGTLSLSSNPDGAEIFIDNVFIGYSPLSYKLPYGNHNVRLVKEGYNDFELTDINISGDDANFNITMHVSSAETTTQQLITTTEIATQTTTQAVTQYTTVAWTTEATTQTTTEMTTQATTETTTETTTELTTETATEVTTEAITETTTETTTEELSETFDTTTETTTNISTDEYNE